MGKKDEKDKELLKETLALKDVLDIDICRILYEEFDGEFIHHVPPSIFFSCMNLRVCEKDLIPKEDQLWKIAYYAELLSKIIENGLGKEWKLRFLANCKISAKCWTGHKSQFIDLPSHEEFFENVEETMKKIKESKG